MSIPQYVDTVAGEMDVSGLFSIGSCAVDEEMRQFEFGESWGTLSSMDVTMGNSSRHRAKAGENRRHIAPVAPVAPTRKRSISSVDMPMQVKDSIQKTNIGDLKATKIMNSAAIIEFHQVLSTVSEKYNEDQIPSMPTRRESTRTKETSRTSKLSSISVASAQAA